MLKRIEGEGELPVPDDGREEEGRMLSGACARPQDKTMCCPGIMIAVPVIIVLGMAGFLFIMLKFSAGGLVPGMVIPLRKPKPAPGRKHPCASLIVVAVVAFFLYKLLSDRGDSSCMVCQSER